MFSLDVRSPADISILLAEDCKDSQEIFCEVLKKTGAKVTCVNNGKECLDLTLQAKDQHKEFDLIVMDIQMPIMDGHTTAKTLREKGCSLPIISMTARSGPEDDAESKAAGCTSHISKLSGMKGLLAAVEKEISHIREKSFDLPVLPIIPDILRENTQYAELALKFLNGLEEKMTCLHEFVKQEDYENIISSTYTLGNISMYGYTQFSRIVNEIQLAAERKDMKGVKEKMKLLERSKKSALEGIPFIKKIIEQK